MRSRPTSPSRPSVSRSQSPDVEGAAAPTLDPGSFRDWDSRVFYDDGRIRRALSEDGLADWRAFAGSRLFAEAVAEGKLVETSDSRAHRRPPGSSATRPASSSTSGSRSSRTRTSGRSRCSRTRRCSSSSSLRRALDEDLILKDATPYNVQFRGAQPVFIDVGSFERLRGRRAVGRLPAVLHALPLPAAAPGLQGLAVPALAARQPRRDPARRGCARSCRSATSSGAASRRTWRSTRASSASTRRRAAR